MFYILSILYTLIGVGVPIFLIAGENLTQKILTPLGVFTICHSFIFYIIPFLGVYWEIGRFSEYYLDQEIEIYYSMFIAFCYQFVVTIVVLLFKKTNINFIVLRDALKRDGYRIKCARIYCWFFTIVGCLVMFNLLLQHINNFSYFMYNRINILSGYGYFSKMLAFSTPLGVLLLCQILVRKSKIDYILLGGMFLCITIIALSLGSRLQALILIPYLYMTWIFTKNEFINIRTMWLLVCVCSGLLLLLSVLSEVRDVVKGTQESIIYNETTNSNKEKIFTELKNSFSHAELFAFVLAEKNRFDFALGYTYFAGFVSFVPRIIWSGKPVGGGPMLANIISPGAYKLGVQDGNSSLTTGAIIELYLNFGFIGIFLGGLLHGVLISRLTIFAKKIRNPLDIALFLITTHFISVLIVYSEFLGAFSAYLFVALPLFLINRIKIWM